MIALKLPIEMHVTLNVERNYSRFELADKAINCGFPICVPYNGLAGRQGPDHVKLRSSGVLDGQRWRMQSSPRAFLRRKERDFREFRKLFSRHQRRVLPIL